MRVYIATSLANFREAYAWAGKLRRSGHEVTSGWIEAVQAVILSTRLAPRDPLSEAERKKILRTNVNELMSSDAVLAITQDDAGKATYCEIGFALAVGIRVIWLQSEGGGRNIFDADTLVTRTTDPTRVLPELRRIEFSQQATIYDSSEEQ